MGLRCTTDTSKWKGKINTVNYKYIFYFWPRWNEFKYSLSELWYRKKNGGSTYRIVVVISIITSLFIHWHRWIDDWFMICMWKTNIDINKPTFRFKEYVFDGINAQFYMCRLMWNIQMKLYVFSIQKKLSYRYKFGTHETCTNQLNTW